MPFRAYQAKEHKLEKKKCTERIGTDLSWSSCFCVLFWSGDFRESDGAEGSYLTTRSCPGGAMVVFLPEP